MTYSVWCSRVPTLGRPPHLAGTTNTAIAGPDDDCAGPELDRRFPHVFPLPAAKYHGSTVTSQLVYTSRVSLTLTFTLTLTHSSTLPSSSLSLLTASAWHPLSADTTFLLGPSPRIGPPPPTIPRIIKTAPLVLMNTFCRQSLASFSHSSLVARRLRPKLNRVSYSTAMSTGLPAKLKPAARVAGQRQDVWYGSYIGPNPTPLTSLTDTTTGPSSTRQRRPHPTSPSSISARDSLATTRLHSSSRLPRTPSTV